MRHIQVKKLILIPTTMVTAFLAVAFLMPATAGNVLRAVPGLQVVVASAVSAATGAGSSASFVSGSGLKQAAGKSTTVSGSSNGSASDADAMSNAQIHAVATAAHPNCGRFGNGFHGGKHNFACPNRPFPPPAVH